MTDIDTSNRAWVGTMGDHVILPFPLNPKLTSEDAYNLAAWLVVCADGISHDHERFDKVREAISES